MRRLQLHPQREGHVLSSLRTRLAALVVLVLACACGILLAARWLQRRELRAHLAQESTQLARFTAGEFERTLEGSRRLLSMLAGFPEAHGAACAPLLRRVLRQHPDHLNLAVTDGAGRVLCSAQPLPEGTQLPGALAIEQALKTGAFSTAGLTTALPLMAEGGTPRGVLIGTLDFEALSRRLGELPASSVSVTAVDRQGRVVGQFPKPSQWLGRLVSDHPLGRRALSGHSETTVELGPDDQRRVFSFVPIRSGSQPVAFLALGIPEAQALGALERGFGASMVGMATLLVLALAATWLGTNFLLVRRIEALQTLAQRLREGDLRARSVLAPAGDELGQLSRSLDGLARELDESNRRRNELQKQLQHAVELREEFLSIAAHELRTPLTSIRLQMELLGRGIAALPSAVRTEPLRNRVTGLLRQIDRLGRLVSALLELSRMSAGRFTLEMDPLDLTEVIRGVAERFSDEAERARSPLKLQLPEIAPALGDKLRLEQVITNLLSNALKYGGGMHIEVILETGASTWRLIVRDHGKGIPPQMQDRIFERFERAGATDASGGLGLGLYISRQIAEAHGGSIRARNAAGGGAELIVELPRPAQEIAPLSPPASASAGH